METRRWIGICLLAALGAGPAAAYTTASFWGTVWDGTPDYSDAAFEPMEAAVAKVASAGDSYSEEVSDLIGKAMMRLMFPNGPLAGLRVVLRSGGEAPEECATTTDEKGKFHFNELAIGEYALTVHKPGKGCRGPQEYTWRLKVDDDYRQTGAELALPAKFITARGTVVDSAGKPLEGIQIAAQEYRYNGELSRWSPVAHVVPTAVTDPKGRFELPGLHSAPFWPGDGGAGGYLLRVAGDEKGFVPCVRRIDVVTKETHAARLRWFKMWAAVVPARSRKEMKDIKWPVPANPRGVLEGVDFTLLRAATLGGRVRDAAGAAVTNAQVWLRQLDAPPYLPLPFPFGPEAVRTDADGRFSIPGLAPGRYRVVVAVAYRNREYPDVPVALREGEVRTDLDLCYEVPPPGRIEASVCEAGSGRPIGVYTAYVERVMGAPDSGETSGNLVKDTNRPGFFAVDNISPGTAHFRINAPGYVSRKAACEVESGKTAIWPVELEPAGAALVRVTCHGVVSRPYELVSFPEGATNAVWGWSRTTNADGRCEIQGLPPGLNRIRAQFLGSGQGRYALVPVQIEAGKTNAVELELEGPCAFDLDLAFPTNATVRAWEEPADAPETESFDAKVDLKVYLWAYESGRIAVTNLPAGDYRIGVQKLESTKSVERVQMKPDQTKTIRLEAGERPAVAVAF